MAAKRKTKGHSRVNGEDKTRSRTSIRGTLSVTQSGFGFVAPFDEGKDIFIPPRFIGSAMDKDEVEVELLPERASDEGSGKGPAGKITDILERSRTSVVGELIAGHKLRPLSKKLPYDIKLSGHLEGAERGDWIEASLIHAERNKKGEELRGAVISVIGKAGRIAADLEAVVREFDLPPRYTQEQNLEAAQLPELEIERKDLTELFCVTIDPEDAKDYDDAISLAPGEKDGEIELGVHISDVAAWIIHGGKWDKEALKRAFTAYLPGRTMPMLPKALTGLISLTPDKNSSAHSVIITLDSKTGEIIRSKRFHSLIKVTKRLTFDEVQSFIDGKTPKSWDKSFREKMSTLTELTRKMREFRKKREEFLEIYTTDVRVLCDEKENKIIGLKREVQTESDELVEDCMLAANTEVAKELIAKSIPGIFRIHPEPEAEKLEEFSVFVSASFGLKTGDLSSRTACNYFLKQIPDDHKKPVITGAFLRSLPRALYTEYHELHFGLGKTTYCHFTSPIRRYPDLIVHQQLWASDFKGKLRSKKDLELIAADCSKKETNNDEAYYAANDRLKLQFLEQEIENGSAESMYEAVITKISSAGMLVDVSRIGIYGFIPAAQLPGHFRFNRDTKKFKSFKGHQDYKCGNFIYVHLDRIDLARGAAIFRPVI